MKLKLFLLFATVAMFTAFVRREPNPWPEAWQATEKLLLIHSHYGTRRHCEEPISSVQLLVSG